MLASSAVAEIAAAQRATNARRITATLALLTALAVPIVAALEIKLGVVLWVGLSAAGQGLAYWLVRRGRSSAGILLASTCFFLEEIGAVAIDGRLGPAPYVVPLVILLIAASAEARWLPASFVASLIVLALEGWLSPWAAGDVLALVTGALFTTMVFVIAIVHVRGTEHAFEIAESRDRALASAAAAAIDSERRYRLIADNTDDLIALLDQNGHALYLSPSHERVLGVEVQPMLGRPPGEFLTMDNIHDADEAFRRALERGEAGLELRIRRADGTLRVLDAHMKRVESEQGPLVAILSRDVTERRDLESRLQASERLEALGRLAGSVAHDFNNLLTVIGGASDLARAALPPDHPARADLDSVLGATGTAAELARQLLTFSRKQLLVRTHLGLPAVLEAQRQLLVRMVGREIQLEYEFEDDLPPVVMPRSHVEQLAMNLAVNARDAMPAGGRLLFALRRRTLAADREVAELVAGPYVELEVRDEGTGIPEDMLPHLFEPFFSTKGVRGTGLGLATCFGIVAQAGGTITLESELGKGTAFHVLLPAAEVAEAPAPNPPAQIRARTVLVVDDDTRIRDMTTRMLRSEGHEVHTASTLDEARRILNDASIPLDAMLTDVVLGNESGTNLIEPFRRARPHARIVVMSGYTPDPSASRSLTANEAQFLPKPFGRDQLLRALRGE